MPELLSRREHRSVPQALGAHSTPAGKGRTSASQSALPAAPAHGLAAPAGPSARSAKRRGDACPPHAAPWESPEAAQAGSAPGGWATQPCKTLLSSRALGGLLIRRVKIIISIFWLRKWSCKASEMTHPGLPPPKPGSYSPKKHIPLSSFNETFQRIPHCCKERGITWSTSSFCSWLYTKRCQFLIYFFFFCWATHHEGSNLVPYKESGGVLLCSPILN